MAKHLIKWPNAQNTCHVQHPHMTYIEALWDTCASEVDTELGTPWATLRAMGAWCLPCSPICSEPLGTGLSGPREGQWFIKNIQNSFISSSAHCHQSKTCPLSPSRQPALAARWLGDAKLVAGYGRHQVQRVSSMADSFWQWLASMPCFVRGGGPCSGAVSTLVLRTWIHLY